MSEGSTNKASEARLKSVYKKSLYDHDRAQILTVVSAPRRRERAIPAYFSTPTLPQKKIFISRHFHVLTLYLILIIVSVNFLATIIILQLEVKGIYFIDKILLTFY